MRYMPDFFDKQLLPFEELPFGPLDAATFSQFAMIQAQNTIPELPEDPEGRRPRLIKQRPTHVHFSNMLRAEYFPIMFNDLITPKKAKQTLFGVNVSPRYRDMLVLDYKNLFDTVRNIQFGAVTCIYKKSFAVICFRGTDASMTGWREDFDMSYMDPVPSQELALNYLETVARQPGMPRKLYIVGHSKGGNLAEYAALRCSARVQKRIVHVYNLDGPGFKPGTFEASDYAALKGRITKIVPQDSLVGITLQSFAPVSVAKSDAEGLDQHSTFTWEINEDFTDFIYEAELSSSAQETKETLETWIAAYDDEELKGLVNSFFDALELTGAKNPMELLKGGSVPKVIEALRKLDGPDRSTLLAAFRAYIKALSEHTGGSVGFASRALTSILDRFPTKDGE